MSYLAAMAVRGGWVLSPLAIAACYLTLALLQRRSAIVAEQQPAQPQPGSDADTGIERPAREAHEDDRDGVVGGRDIHQIDNPHRCLD